MRTYIVTVSFDDTRIKPRHVAIQTTGTRKDARRQARAEMAKLHPTWKIAQVTADAKATVVTVEVTAKAKSTRTRQPADPAKAAASAIASQSFAKGTAEWWGLYRSVRADQRKGVLFAVSAAS